MQIDDLDGPYQAFVFDLLGRSGFAPKSFHVGIGPDDEMVFKGILPGYPGGEGAAFFRFVESSLLRLGAADPVPVADDTVLRVEVTSSAGVSANAYATAGPRRLRS